MTFDPRVVRTRLDLFQRLALWTTAATYFLIAVGGLVRASGSGLGCPDWPKCFGRWIPPLHARDVPAHIDPALFNVAKAWTEYLNRLTGVIVGFLIFTTLVLAIRRYRNVPRVLVPTAIAFLLVAIEGGIGGVLVASKLKPLILTVHLTLALVIVSLLVYATVSAFFPGGRPIAALPSSRVMLARLSFGVALVTLVQIALGALVRGEIQLAAALPREEWIGAAGVLFGVHRTFALVDAFAIVLLVWYVQANAAEDRWLRGAAFASLVLVAAQAAAGYGLSMFELPPVLQVAHLWIGVLLLGALMVLCLLAYRLDPRAAPPPEPEPQRASTATAH